MCANTLLGACTEATVSLGGIMFVYTLLMRRGHPWAQQGAEPLPLRVTPMSTERNNVTGIVYAPLWSARSV